MTDFKDRLKNSPIRLQKAYRSETDESKEAYKERGAAMKRWTGRGVKHPFD